MEAALSILVAIFFSASIYMLLSSSLIRIMIGVALLSNAVNLLIFTAGRLVKEIPPIIPKDAMVPAIQTANPLPQALILTAIVISFSFFAFLLVLVFRTYQALGSDRTGELKVAEPPDQPQPPTGY